MINMAVDISVETFINILSQQFFGGSTTLCGLALMIGAWLVVLVILANIKAPIVYSIVPLVPICIFFNAYGILNTDVMMITILLCAIVVAGEVKKIVTD